MLNCTTLFLPQCSLFMWYNLLTVVFAAATCPIWMCKIVILSYWLLRFHNCRIYSTIVPNVGLTGLPLFHFLFCSSGLSILISICFLKSLFRTQWTKCCLSRPSSSLHQLFHFVYKCLRKRRRWKSFSITLKVLF